MATALQLLSNLSSPVSVLKGGSALQTRPRINIIEGSNVTIAVTDDSANYKTDITISATGGGGSGTGTVTSVDLSGGTTGMTFSGGPITSSGTITMAGTLEVANGGTGRDTFTSGYLKASGTTAFTTVTSIPGTDITGNISGNASSLTSVLPISLGGTNATTATDARTSLGLGSVATENVVPIAKGGTGATTATLARTALDVPSTSGGGATGTWGISISGNAATVTNGVYTSSSYADPSWITSLAGSKVSGNISGNAANVTGVVQIANGGTGATTASAALNALGGYSNTNPAGYTTNTGTVTSVTGNGSVNGITLTGTVTTSGNITLGGTLSGVSLTSQVTGVLPAANGGVPSGGAKYATLKKNSTTNYDASWYAPEIINVNDYGAVGNGTTDDTAAITNALAQLAADGPIVGLKLLQTVSGFTIPNSDPVIAWGQRPAVAAVGGLGSSFAAVGNITPGGYLCGFEITNPGSGYAVLAVSINRTNGTNTITKAGGGAFDSRLVAGVSVRHESLDNGATITARSVDGTTLTLSQNNNFTNTDTFVFGLPWFTVGGTAYYDLIYPVIGTHKVIKFPAGSYNVSTLGVLAGLSNVTVDARGATFRINSISYGVWLRFCTSVEWLGGTFVNTASKFQVPSTRTRYAGQLGLNVGCCNFVNFRDVELWDSLEFSIGIGGGTTANAPWSSEVNFYNVVAGNGLGDGIHYTTGARYSRVSGARIIQPQDDALAVVNDSNSSSKRPNNIVFEDCTLEGGIYRGCVAIGADDITFKNIRGFGTHGPFCWAKDEKSHGSPSRISFLNISGEQLGNTAFSPSDSNSGVGIKAESMTGLTLRDLTFTQHSSVSSLNNTIFAIDEATITTYDADRQFVQSIGTTTTLTGTVDADLSCTAGNGFASVTLPAGRWLVQGTITVRSSTGSAGSYYPVFFDGSTEYGRGSTQSIPADGATRHQITCQAIITANTAINSVYFRIKNGGGGFTLDAGSTFGPNSFIVATRLG